MTSWSVTIPGPPIGKGRPRATVRGGQVRTYTPKRTQQWEARASVVLRDAWAPRAPLDGPIEVQILALFPRPGRMVWKRKPMPRAPFVSSPDADNVVKAVLDAAEKAGVLRNDRTVYSVRMEKWYASGDEGPGVVFALSALDDETLVEGISSL